jgi:hypothetical protein
MDILSTGCFVAPDVLEHQCFIAGLFVTGHSEALDVLSLEVLSSDDLSPNVLSPEVLSLDLFVTRRLSPDVSLGYQHIQSIF